MKSFRAILLVWLLGGLVNVMAAAVLPMDVSMIQLIANPKAYHGKAVRVIGFAELGINDNAIYLHEEDYKQDNTKNGLWIELPDDVRPKKAEYDLKYVVVEGVFNAKEMGNLGLWSGSIEKITSFTVRKKVK